MLLQHWHVWGQYLRECHVAPGVFGGLVFTGSGGNGRTRTLFEPFRCQVIGEARDGDQYGNSMINFQITNHQKPLHSVSPSTFCLRNVYLQLLDFMLKLCKTSPTKISEGNCWGAKRLFDSCFLFVLSRFFSSSSFDLRIFPGLKQELSKIVAPQMTK